MQRGAYDDVTDITKYFSEQFDKWFPWLKSYEFLSKVPTYKDAKPEILQQKILDSSAETQNDKTNTIQICTFSGIFSMLKKFLTKVPSL